VLEIVLVQISSMCIL